MAGLSIGSSMKNIPYGRQEILPEDIAAVTETLLSDFLTQGPAVDKFEKDFAQIVESPYALAVNNATAGLHLAVQVLGVKPGQKVICPPISFVASANCVRYCGGEVEFVDIDPKTYCLDLAEVEKKLKKSKPGEYAGVVLVHLAGYPADVESLAALIKPYDLWIIEDACHAPGAQFQNKLGEWASVGSGLYSDISTFSFHPVKHIATGEGGMLTTQSASIYEKLKLLRSHGIERSADKMMQNDGGWYYEMQTLGYNYRMPDLLCSLGSSQLKRFEKNIQRRREIADRYDQELHSDIMKPYRNSSVRHGFHLYVIQVERRKELYECLKSAGINTQVHYIPIHLQPYYRERYGRLNLPASEKYYSQALSLPMYHGLKNSEQDRVIQAVNLFFEKKV